jgi:excisionase family DNA binding protein
VQHERTAVATPATRLRKPNSGCLTYTVSEAAALAGVSVDSYYRALKAGIVPGRKIGGRWVVSRVKLVRYLEGED